VAFGADSKEGVPKDGGFQLRAAALPRAGLGNLCLLWPRALRRNDGKTALRGEGGEREERSWVFRNTIMCFVHVEPELSGCPPVGLQLRCGTWALATIPEQKAHRIF